MFEYPSAFALVGIGVTVSTIVALPVIITVTASYLAFHGALSVYKYFNAPPTSNLPTLFSSSASGNTDPAHEVVSRFGAPCI